MNGKQSIKNFIMVVCMIALITGNGIIVRANSTEDVVTTVSSFSGLYQAMIQANDGDVIGITGIIDQNAIQNMGYADKHIIIKRMNSSAILRIQSESIYQNITFDGGGIDFTAAFVITNGNVTFQDCVFQNSLTSIANGGAVYTISKSASFKNCTFNNNSAVEGGHIYVANPANVTIDNCTFENGHAISDGGAIKNTTQPPAKCDITSSIITNNSADKYGGGISNTGYIAISGTKIFNNSASGGGADIARFSYYFSMYDSLEIDGLLELYKDDEIVPKGWVNDYNAEADVEFPAGFDPSSSNVLMKLDYEIPPTEVILDSSSLGVAGDGKITELETGKYYKITVDGVISYSKSDGTLTATESEASPLIGTEIIGLTNGEIYLVEEFTPEPTTVLLDSASLGIADNGKITGLSAGKIYKISVDETTNYTMAGGTLTSNESEAEALTGTEIIGLTNGMTYLVEEYTPPVEEPPAEEEPEEPTEEQDPEAEDETEEPTEEETDQEQEQEEETVNDPDEEQETENQSNTNSQQGTNDNSNDNSQEQRSSSSTDIDEINPSSSVNNYLYIDGFPYVITEDGAVPYNGVDIPTFAAIGEASKQDTSKPGNVTQEQSITIDADKLTDDKELTINVNVDIVSSEADTNEAIKLIEAIAANNADDKEPAKSEVNITWVELVKIFLLFGIFICVFIRPISK